MNAESMHGSRIRVDAPLARFTSWRVGGPADRLITPRDSDELLAVLAELPAGEPVFWLGLGSNLLVRDGGIRGTVLRTLGALGELRAEGDGEVLAEAGVACAKLARFCNRRGFTGAEFFAGIPGTVGGALAMNAGAWGGETWSRVAAVTVADRAGVRRERSPAEYRIGYRQVDGPGDEWFLGARFSFPTGGDPAALVERTRELLAQRAESQPTGVASGGSVFRNPPGDHAARLIESSGLKGLRIGGASVSTKHANFIVHAGDASAADIEALIGEVGNRVERATGVRLQPEVRIVGEERLP